MSDLMPRVRYHAVKPQSEQDTYTSSNKPEFLISVGSGRSLVPNSVRILADVRVLSDSSNSASRSTGQRTFDRNLGGHAFIDTVNVNFSNLGSIEENTNYARYVGMDAIASKNEYDMLNSSNACELRGVTQVYTTDLCQGITPSLTTGTPVTEDADFSLKPLCCLNKMDSRVNGLPMARTGIIRLSIVLADNLDAIFGQAADVNCGYELRNLRCDFKSVPDSKTPEEVTMGIVHDFKSNLLSNEATISTNVAAMCDSVAINFIQNQHESVPVYNSYKMENVQGLEQIQYLFNSQSNSLVTYPITDRTEMLQRFIEAMEAGGHNQVSIDKYRANAGWSVGLKFDEQIDLRNNVFTLQLASTVDQNYPVNCFMYFFSRRVV
tara:strand:- start:2171 stop:3307 length:1137 start_codon:yes stop_codon:yes gene_type:complete